VILTTAICSLARVLPAEQSKRMSDDNLPIPRTCCRARNVPEGRWAAAALIDFGREVDGSEEMFRE